MHSAGDTGTRRTRLCDLRKHLIDLLLGGQAHIKFDPVGVAIANLYPLPNSPGTADGRNNFFNGNIKVKEDYFVHISRVDHAFSDSYRMFVRLHYDWWEEDKNDHFANRVNGIILNRINRGLAFDNVFMLNPTLLFNLRYGITQQEFPEQRVTRGYDLA
jgi:hypothetical protein